MDDHQTRPPVDPRGPELNRRELVVGASAAPLAAMLPAAAQSQRNTCVDRGAAVVLSAV
jgi:hypothetical protein